MEQQKQHIKYFENKLKLYCKEYYFRNGMQTTGAKNPMDMNGMELGVFIDKHSLELQTANIMNVCILKFSNIMTRLSSAKLPKDVLEILDILYKESNNSFIIGGCTRDIILGETPKDYDFVTDIPYERLKELFKDSTFKETGTNFLVFNLNYKGTDYEIANFRKDSKTSDGRRPDSVEIGTIQEDAERRDFTVNNIYWNPNELFMLDESVDDILNRKLRFVGNPEERIKEDSLRGIRFYRLLKTKNLTPDANSLRAVRRLWETVISSNQHRIMLEIEKMAGL